MPLLYALGQHPALVEFSRSLLLSEQVYAFLDDIYITCHPERVRFLYDTLSASLWTHANIRIHHGKKQRSGILVASHLVPATT